MPATCPKDQKYKHRRSRKRDARTLHKLLECQGSSQSRGIGRFVERLRPPSYWRLGLGIVPYNVNDDLSVSCWRFCLGPPSSRLSRRLGIMTNAVVPK